MKRNEEVKLAGYKGQRLRRFTNTQIIRRCDNCNCITKDLMDDDGNRFCGKCKERKPKV